MKRIVFKNGQAPYLTDTILNKLQDNIEDAIDEMKENLLPVGSTYATDSKTTNPSTIVGFGIWELLEGMILVGASSTDSDFAIGKTGGAKTHTLTTSEIPSHIHELTSWGGAIRAYKASGPTSKWIQDSEIDAGGEITATQATGQGESFNICQPYRVVSYLWVRVE